MNRWNSKPERDQEKWARHDHATCSSLQIVCQQLANHRFSGPFHPHNHYQFAFVTRQASLHFFPTCGGPLFRRHDIYDLLLSPTRRPTRNIAATDSLSTQPHASHPAALRHPPAGYSLDYGLQRCSLFSGVTRGLLQRCSGYLADRLCGGPRTLQDRVAEASWLPCKRPCSDAVRLQVFHAGKVSAAAMQRAYLLVATPEGLRACRCASARPRAPAAPDTGVFCSNADAPARRVRSTPPTQTDTSPHSCSCSWLLH